MKELTTNIIIILSGPIASLLVILSGKGFRFDISFVKYIALGTAIALAISVLSHYIIRSKPTKANFLSVITTELVYALLTIVTANDPETKAWLSVILMFLPIFTLPIAISVSIGTGRIIRSNKKAEFSPNNKDAPGQTPAR